MLRVWVLAGLLTLSSNGFSKDTPRPTRSYDAKTNITKIQAQRMPLRVVVDPEGAFAEDSARLDLSFAGWWLGKKCCDPNATKTFSLTLISVSEGPKLVKRHDLSLEIDGQRTRLLDLQFSRSLDQGKEIEVVAAGIRDTDVQKILTAKLTRIGVGSVTAELDARELAKLREFVAAFRP
ncbi:MAG: hypothetical protein HY791_19170 [Deltaproteobacteria bacterium]|nr:hypothetical protein [Deltaproteobacteria bacterium]